MFILKGLLWTWLVLDSIAFKSDTDHEKYRRIISISTYLICLTLIYVFGGKQ